MKNIAKILSTAAVVLLASCQAEIKPAEEAISGAKHTVKISSVMTKTELNDDGQSVSWTKDDEDRIHVFENGVEAAASDLAATAAVDGSVMSILADFYGTAPYTYTAILSGYFADNKATIPDEQEAYSTTFDGIADILVAEPVNSAAQIENFTFNYKRVVAVNKMTLKGLAASETINSITITSDKDILGSYNMTSDSWEMSGKTLLLENLGEAVTDASGNCVVYFVTAPVEDANLSVNIVTNDNLYQKTFSKSISFVEGKVTRFNVNLDGCKLPATPIFYESFDKNEGTGGNDGSWSGSIASSTLSADNAGWNFVKGSGANYCAKFGTGSAIGSATTPALNYAGNAVLTFKAAAWNGNSESTELKISVVGGGDVSDATVILAKGAWDDYEVTLSDLTTASKIKFEGKQASNSRFFLDEVRVVKSDAPVVTKYDVNCATVANGTISASPAKAAEGAIVTLTATPNTGYEFVSWNVTGATVADATSATTTFTMPAADVNVSATFKEKEVESLKTMDEIFAAATTAGSTAADAKVTFNNWVISGVKNSNAYLTDNNGKGLIIYASGHGFVVGDILSGTVNCKVQLYNGASELTALTSATEGLTVTKGGVATPQTISIASLSGVNTGAVLSFAELTYNGAEFTDGANTLKPYTTFITLPTLVNGKKYSVAGVYIQYNTTKEIAPRSAEDIVEVVAPKYAVSIASGIENGTVSVDYTQATAGQTVTITATPASGYKVKSVSAVKTASREELTVTANKFTMPAEAVTVSAEFEESGDTGSWTAATMTAGTNGSSAKVNDKDAIKVGTSSKGGDMTITVPAGATKIRFYAAAWNGVTGLSLNITPAANVSTASVALTADTGIAGNSPFTLNGTESSYLFEIDLNDISVETALKLTSSATKRFVVWGAEYAN